MRSQQLTALTRRRMQTGKITSKEEVLMVEEKVVGVMVV
jgi:hypothetical protein